MGKATSYISERAADKLARAIAKTEKSWLRSYYDKINKAAEKAISDLSGYGSGKMGMEVGAYNAALAVISKIPIVGSFTKFLISKIYSEEDVRKRTANTSEAALIKSIQTKAKAGAKLTPAEQEAQIRLATHHMRIMLAAVGQSGLVEAATDVSHKFREVSKAIEKSNASLEKIAKDAATGKVNCRVLTAMYMSYHSTRSALLESATALDFMMAYELSAREVLEEYDASLGKWKEELDKFSDQFFENTKKGTAGYCIHQTCEKTDKKSKEKKEKDPNWKPRCAAAILEGGQAETMSDEEFNKALDELLASKQ